jgi:hypothetical protein
MEAIEGEGQGLVDFTKILQQPLNNSAGSHRTEFFFPLGKN